jgi:hypothetical protein
MLNSDGTFKGDIMLEMVEVQQYTNHNIFEVDLREYAHDPVQLANVVRFYRYGDRSLRGAHRNA